MGLGLLGGALNDAKFLLEAGAILTITDLKSEQELAPSIKKLSKYKNIKYVLGQHDLEDFRQADLILQPGNVPTNSIYLIEAKKNNIPIHESESLFMQLIDDGVTTVGVTGTRGKSTTTTLIYEILKSFYGRKVHLDLNKSTGLVGRKTVPTVFLGGNVKGISTLSLLSKIKLGDIVVMELDSWCLSGFRSIKNSPNISVFTNFMSDHLNFYLKDSKNEAEALEKYFDDKAQIYLNQKPEDYLVCDGSLSEKIGKINSHKVVVSTNLIPEKWKLKIFGEHNLKNASYAVKVAEIMKVPEMVIKKAVENFKGVEGRLELVKKYRGVSIYNDTTSTTPDALHVALKTIFDDLKGKGKIILFAGGSNKNLNMSQAVKDINVYADKVVLLSGTGTETIKQEIFANKKENAIEAGDLKTGVKQALAWAKRGDVILFSPGFASFGMFKNEFDRGDKFLKIVNNLK